MNAAELSRAMLDAKADCDDAITVYRTAIVEDAEAADQARRAKARAYVTCREKAPKATVAILDAMVDLETSDAQLAARMADGRRNAALEVVRNARQWLSALQSLAAAQRAEAQLAAYEPREVA
jgi:hypothetical protein